MNFKNVSVSTKAIVPIFCLLAVSGLLSFGFYSYKLSTDLLANKQKAVEQQSQIIFDGLQVGMITARRDLLQTSVEGMVQNKIAREVTLLNAAGKVTISSNPARVGLTGYADERTELAEGAPSLFQFRRDEKGERYATTVLPIVAGPKCASCHAQPGQMLGTLVVASEIESEMSRIRDYQIAEALRDIMIVIMISLLVFVVMKLVIIRPLGRVTNALTTLAETGNLNTEPLEVASEDEVGLIAKSYNRVLARQQKVASQAEAVARGDFGAETLQERISGNLGAAVRTMIENLRRCAAQARAVAAGDLRADILNEKIEGELGESLATMTRNLREIIGLLKNVADQIGAGANELLAATKQFETGSRQQGERANEVSSAVAEMSATVQQVAASAKAAEQVAVGTENAAGSGANVVNDTVGGLSEITAANEDAAGRVKHLGERGKEIAKIVNVISAITEQTNLLALNAAIEAARAGEHGKGFAVVADEVRKLAERSSASADEIRTIVERIMEDIDATTTGMAKSTECGRQSIEMSNQLKTTFGQIQGMVSDSRARISEIAVAVSQQALASDNISSSVDGISDVIRQSESATRQLLTQVTELKGVAEELESAIGRFQV